MTRSGEMGPPHSRAPFSPPSLFETILPDARRRAAGSGSGPAIGAGEETIPEIQAPGHIDRGGEKH